MQRTSIFTDLQQDSLSLRAFPREHDGIRAVVHCVCHVAYFRPTSRWMEGTKGGGGVKRGKEHLERTTTVKQSKTKM